jgi:hypothetical protein
MTLFGSKTYYMAQCSGCGLKVSCPCQLNSEGLCPTCAHRKSMGLPFIKVARYVKMMLGW